MTAGFCAASHLRGGHGPPYAGTMAFMKIVPDAERGA